MSEATVTIIVALLSGSGLISGIFSIINTAILRHQTKGDKQKDIEKKLAELEKKTADNKMDVLRVQMLLLMSDYPESEQEILKIAELYFKDMGGNFYMDSIFNKWMNEHDITKPSWFKNE